MNKNTIQDRFNSIHIIVLHIYFKLFDASQVLCAQGEFITDSDVCFICLLII